MNKEMKKKKNRLIITSEFHKTISPGNSPLEFTRMFSDEKKKKQNPTNELYTRNRTNRFEPPVEYLYEHPEIGTSKGSCTLCMLWLACPPRMTTLIYDVSECFEIRFMPVKRKKKNEKLRIFKIDINEFRILIKL